jgi:hypothetical protein
MWRRVPRGRLVRWAIPVAIGLLLVACSAQSEPGSPAPAASPTGWPWSEVATVRPKPGPPGPTWWLRPDQLAAQSAAGTFAIKLVEIANLDVHVYYALRAPQPGPPRATASIVTTACPLEDVADRIEVAWVQPFGQLGDLDLGVIHVGITDQPGQVISLAIIPPGAAAPPWTLSFLQLQQIAPIGHPQGMEGVSIDQGIALPEVRISSSLAFQPPATPGSEWHGWGGYVALAQAGTTPTSYLPTIFFVSGTDGTVEPISRTAFMSGSGSAAAAYVPRQTYPPTPLPTGAAVQTPTPPYVHCS